MPATHGSNTSVYWGAYDLTDFLNSVQVDRSRDTADVTGFGDTGKKYIPGLHDATVSAEGIYDATTLGGSDDALRASLNSDTPQAVSVYPQGIALGDPGWGLRTIESGLAVTSPTDGVNRVSAEAQSDTSAERLRLLKPPSVVSASDNSTQLIDASSSTLGAALYVHVFALTVPSGNGPSFRLQHSADGVTFVDAGAQIQTVAAPGGYRARSTISTLFARTRCRTDINNATSVTFQAGMSRTPTS